MYVDKSNFYMLFIIWHFTLYSLAKSEEQCLIPTDVVKAVHTYSNHIKLNYTITCENKNIHLSDNFIIVYNNDTYTDFDDNINYFIVSNFMISEYRHNVFRLSIKIRLFEKFVRYLMYSDYKHVLLYYTSILESEIGKIAEVIRYYGMSVDVLSNEFNSTILANHLDEYTNYKEVVILNLFDNPSLSTKLFLFYQNHTVQYPVSLVSFFIDESYIRVDPGLVKNTQILSGYLYGNSIIENIEFENHLNLSSNVFIDDLLFQTIIVLEFLTYIPDVFPKSNPYNVRRQLLNKSIHLAGQDIYLSPSNTFNRPIFIGKINEEGNITNILRITVNSPDYNAIIENTENDSFIESQNVIYFGFLSTLKSKIPWTFLEGVITAIDDINNNETLFASHIIMKLPKNLNDSVVDSYLYLKQFGVVALFYFEMEDQIFEAMQILLTYPDAPYFIVNGFYNGKECHPKMIYLGMTGEAIFNFFLYEKRSDNIIIISPNSRYGRNIIIMIQDTLTLTGKELILIKRVEPNKNDIRTAIREVSDQLTSDSIIFIAMDGCKFQQDILDVIQNNTEFKKHTINIFNLNVECNGFNENSWKGYYTAHPFLHITNRNTSIYEVNSLITNNKGISSTLYLGYYGTLLFHRLLVTVGENDVDAILQTISKTTDIYENDNKMSFTNNNYLSCNLQYGLSEGNGQFELIDESPFPFISHPFYKIINSGGYSVCNWNAKEYPYIKDIEVFIILIIDSNYYLANFAQAIVDSISTPHTSNDLIFNILYYPLDINQESFNSLIEYFIKFHSVRCILLNQDVVPTKNKYPYVPYVIITPHDENTCDDFLIYFGFSRNRVISNFMENLRENNIVNIAYITKVPEGLKDTTNEYIQYLLPYFYSDSYTYTYLRYTETEKVKEFIKSVIEPTYIFIGLSPTEDFEFTDYLINRLNYNSNLITLIHSHPGAVYFNSKLEIKNQYFVVDHLLFSYSEMGMKLFNYLTLTNIDIYELYYALYYIQKTASEIHMSYVDNFITQLSKAKYKVYEFDVETSITNHQLNSAFSYEYVKSKYEIYYSEIPSKYIPNTFTLLDYNLNNEQVQICDLDSGMMFRNIALITIGFIQDSTTLSKEFSYALRFAMIFFLDYLESSIKQIMFKVHLENINSNSNPETILQKFHDKNITHIFGFYYYDIIKNYLPYLSKYNVYVWYFSSLPNPYFCNDHVIAYYVPDDSLSVIYKESKKALLLYSDREYIREIAPRIVKVLNEYELIKLLPYDSTNDDVKDYIDKILLEMEVDCEIYILFRIDDFEVVVPKMIHFFQLMKSIQNWSIISLVDYVLLKNKDKIYDGIKFITAVDFIHDTDIKETIINIYKTYNRKKYIPSIIEIYFYVSITAIINLAQRSEYNDIEFMQNVLRRNILYDERSIFRNPFVEPSLVIRNSYNNYTTLYYFNTTYLSSFFNSSSLIRYSCYFTNETKLVSNYTIAVIVDKMLKSQYFVLNIANIIKSIVGNTINDKQILLKSIEYNELKYESYIEEIKKDIKVIDLIICATNSTIRDTIDQKILRKYRKVMYYLYDDIGISCSPYIFYFGLPSNGKIKYTIPYLYETCESSVIIYDDAENLDLEIDFFKKELNTFHNSVLNTYKILTDDSDLTGFLKTFTYNLPEDGCILNFLDGDKTTQLINILNSNTYLISKIYLISMNIKFINYSFPPTRITHKIITYFNPINPLPLYSNILDTFYTTYGIKVTLHQPFYNAVNAIHIWKLVMLKTKRRYNTTRAFITEHNSVSFNNGLYDILVQTNHHLFHPRYVFTEEDEVDITRLAFRSNTTYNTYVYGEDSMNVCFHDKSGFHEKFQPKRIITVGFIIDSSNEEKKAAGINYLTAIPSFNQMKDDIFLKNNNSRGDFVIRKIVYNINSHNVVKCEEAIKYLSSINIDYVISALSVHCIKAMIPFLNETSSPILFATGNLLGNICHKNVVFTSIGTNQILNPFLSYFLSFLSENSNLHFIYSTNKVTFDEISNIVNFEIYTTNLNIILHQYSSNNRKLYSLITNIFTKPGLIITLITSTELYSLLQELNEMNYDTEKWKIIVLVESHYSLLLNIPSHLLDNIFISSISTNDEITKPILDYNFLKDHKPIYAGPTQIAMDFIKYLIVNEKEKNIGDLYGIVFHSDIVGDFQLDESNNLRYPLKFVGYSNGEKKILFPSSYLYKPDVHLFDDYNEEKCDFLHDHDVLSFGEETIEVVVVYRNIEELNIIPLLVEVINFVNFNTLETVRYYTHLTLLYELEDIIRNYIEGYIYYEAIYPCFIITNSQFDIEISDLLENSNKFIFITNYRKEYCLNNLITTETKTMQSLSKVIQQLTVIYMEVKYILFYDLFLEDLYKQIQLLLIETGNELIIFQSIDEFDEDEIRAKVYCCSVVYIVFCDSNDNNCMRIENIISSLPVASALYFQWYYESKYFLKKVSHLVYSSAYPTKSEDMRYYTKIYEDESLYDQYSLNRFYDFLKLVYIWMKLEQSDDPSITNSIYSTPIDTEIGPIILNPNNRISSKMVISLMNYYGKVYKYYLSDFVELKIYDIEARNKDYMYICNWKDENGLIMKDIITIGVINRNLTGLNVPSFLINVLLHLINMLQYNEEGLFKSYIVKPSVLYYSKGNDDFKLLLDKLYSIKSLIAIFDITSTSLLEHEDYIASKEVLYFGLPFTTNTYCSPNILNVGLNTLSLVKFTYLDFIETVKKIFIVHENDDIGDSFIKNFGSETNGMNIEIIPIIDHDYKDMFQYLPSCLEKSLECAIVITTYLESAQLMLSDFAYYYDIKFGEDIYLYFYYHYSALYVYNIEKLKGAIFVSSYLSTLEYYENKGEDELIYDFPNFIRNEFSNTVEPNFMVENVVTGYLILKKILKKSDRIDYNQMLSLVHNMYFDSPSGPVYFGGSNNLMSDVIFAKVTTKYPYLSKENTRKAINPLFWNNRCTNITTPPIVVGLLFDFSETSNIASRIHVSVIKESLVNQNIIGGINDRQIMTKLYCLYRKETSDKKTMKRLMDNEDISIILGCETHYCNNMISKFLYNSQKLLFSNANYLTEYCHANVIAVGNSAIQRFPTVLKYLNSTSSREYILVYSNITDDKGDLSFLNEINIIFKKIYGITLENSEEEIRKVINYLEAESSNKEIVVFNLLSEKLLVDFEKDFTIDNEKLKQVVQIIFNLDIYLLDFNKTKLTGNLVIHSYFPNSNSYLTALFEETISTRFGSIQITQKMALYDVSVKLLISTYKQAQKLVTEDGIIDVLSSGYNYKIPFQYLRRASQMISFETSCGLVVPTVNNELLYSYEVGQISPTGYTISVKSDTRDEITRYNYTNPKNCYFGPTFIIYTISKYTTVPSLTLSILIEICMIIIAIIIMKYRKKLKSCSPFFICYYIVASILLIIFIYLFNQTMTNLVECQTIVALLFLSLINCVSVIIFKTWRIHAIYNNDNLRKSRISDIQVVAKIIYVVLPDIVICLIFGLCNSLGDIKSNRSIELSSSIKYVDVYRCKVNGYFFIIQMIIFVVLMMFGLYFAWGTRKTDKEFNDSQALASSIGLITFILVFITILETSITFEVDVKYVFELIGTSAILMIVLFVLIGPKFYLILVKKKIITSSSSESDPKEEQLKAIMSPAVDGSCAVDYSKVTTQSTTVVFTTRLYPVGSAVNVRISQAVPGLYSKKRGLELIRDDREREDTFEEC